MTARRSLTAVGAGVTVGLTVAGALTALLDAVVAFATILGLPVGLLAGLATLAWVLSGLDRLDAPVGRVLGGVAAAGYAVIGYAALSDANVAGIRGALTPAQVAAVALAVGGATVVALWLLDRTGAGPS